MYTKLCKHTFHCVKMIVINKFSSQKHLCIKHLCSHANCITTTCTCRCTINIFLSKLVYILEGDGFKNSLHSITYHITNYMECTIHCINIIVKWHKLNNIGRHSTFKATSGSRQYHKSRKNIYTLVHGYLFSFF